MSVPNYFPLVRQVYDAGHYDLTTKIGCGRFIEDVAWAIHHTDPHIGHLKKPNSLGGANKWNGHAVDNICYVAGDRATAVDIVTAGESTHASLQWSPDQEGRYLASDWYAPAGPDSFQMTPHGTRLGASLFYLMAAARGHDAVLAARGAANLRWLTETLHADYIRMFVTVGGKEYQSPSGRADPWQYAGSFVSWPDLQQTFARAIDWAFDHGLTVAPTLVGEGAQFGTEGELLHLADMVADVVKDRRQKIELLEAWNEYSVTGGTATLCRSLAHRLRSRLGSEFPIALDTPQTAMSPPGEHGDPLPAEVSTFYGGSAANVITPQWSREEPNPRDMGASAPASKYAHEGRGPGASTGGDVNDWLPLSHDYIQMALLGYRGNLLHTSAGIWGGRCHEYWPRENLFANLFDHPNMAAIADALTDVRAGRMPNPHQPQEPPVPQIQPYPDEQTWWKDFDQQVEALYQKHGQSSTCDVSARRWPNRTAYDIAAGLTKEASSAKHLAELDAELSRP